MLNSTSNSDHYFVTVLAGGSGTRLWPLSRSARPKQLLALSNERSLIQNTLSRIEKLVPPERVLILTEASHADELREHAPEIPAENIIVEPARRGTAGALALGASIIASRDPDSVMASVHSDAYIEDDDEFIETLAAALSFAESTQTLVTLGIKPTAPSSQLGYIQGAEVVAQSGRFQLRRVAAFKEKPDSETAKTYVADGSYYWNPGVFVWSTRIILEEFAAYVPEIFDVISAIRPSLGKPNQESELARLYPTTPIEAIDTGIMERSSRVTVVPATFGWADIGSWAELYDILPQDEQRNASVGRHVLHDSQGVLAFSRDRTIATVGLNDLVIVDTGDVILVCPRDRAQETKQLVEELQRQRRSELL